MSDLLTVSEVAGILRVDNTTVRRWVKAGALEAVVLPHVNKRQGYRIKRETVERLIGGTLLPAQKEERDHRRKGGKYTTEAASLFAR